MHNFKFAFLSLSFLLFIGCSQKKPELSQPLTVNIIHINDHHSHLEAEEMPLTIEGQQVYANIGGFPRVVSQIKALQAQKENPITLHAGDALQGTMYYTVFKSRADADMMNLIAWDAFALGNHEFDDGDAELDRFLERLDTQHIVAANVIASQQSPLHDNWRPYYIIERGGQKIAILGIEIAGKTQASSNPSQEIVFVDELTTVKRYVKEIEKQGINKIILLSHFGYENDQALASQVEGIDVIIDGDSHTLMGDFSMVGLQSVEKTYPKVVNSPSAHPVCMAQAWNYAYLVGSLAVQFDEKGYVKNCQGTPILLMGDSFKETNEKGEKVAVDMEQQAAILGVIDRYPQLQIVAEDTQAVARLAQYKDQIETKKKEVLGEVTTYIGHNRIPNDRYDGHKALALGSDIAPLVAKSFYLQSKRADFCIQNAGGVRSGLKAGALTVEDIYSLLPFSNTLVELKLSGAEVKMMLEAVLSSIYDTKTSRSGSFPYGYAIRYDVDTTQSQGNRVINIEIKNRKTGEWEALKNNRSYVVVTNSYLASGKDGYDILKTIKEKTDTYLDYAMSFAEMVKQSRQVEKLPEEEHSIKSFK
ncbi:MAG: NAD nucleotidase [Campylobacterales bacterium]|nr:NAD nucleotidase [Campylobacterales bacterium]